MTATGGGETDLSKMLKTLKPVLNKGEYIFASIPEEKLVQIDLRQIVGLFREVEGVTIVVSREFARSINLEFQFVAAWITLTVHSSLEASGLTAAFSDALAKANISCNVMAAFYHDHIFVPFSQAQQALEILDQLASSEGRNF